MVRLVGRGELKEATGALAVTLDLAASDQYVYCQVVGNAVKIWSGPRCTDCYISGPWLRRCQIHRGLEFVASQMLLLD